jgi:hypothetical protein
MIEVNKEQIEEVIKRFQSLAYWYYMSSSAEEYIQKEVARIGGRVTKLFVTKEGFYRIDLDNGQFCLYDIKILLAPVKIEGSLDNFNLMIKLANENDLLPDDLVFCKEYANIILFLFRQSVTAKFIGVLSENERNSLVQVLSDLVPYPEKEKKNE